MLLPLAEFAYNNALHTITGVFLFYANKGYNPAISVHSDRDIASARARDFVTNLDELHRVLQENISEAQKCYQGPVDSRCALPPLLEVGQEVFVKAKYFRMTRPSHKLSARFEGPFKVIAQPGPQSYILKLPDSLRSVHLVFHISMLEPATLNTISDCTQPLPPPIEIDGDKEFEISEILDSKIDRRRKCKLQYLVCWLGYEGTDEETSWILTEEVHASEAISDFHSAYPSKPGPMDKL